MQVYNCCFQTCNCGFDIRVVLRTKYHKQVIGINISLQVLMLVYKLVIVVFA